MASEYEERKRLTFKQAEGAEPLPTQLKLGEISTELRALLWAIFHDELSRNKPEWGTIARRYHVERQYKPIDDFFVSANAFSSNAVKTLAFEGTYLDIFDFIQWILRQPETPSSLHERLEDVLRRSRAAYAVFEGDTIIPIGSEAERETLARAFADVAASEFNGARAHLRNAGAALTAGDFPGSVRETIHAVESVARVLEPSVTTLPPALAKLEKSVRIHPALRKGFGNLYGFTSDEKGVRHALLDEPEAHVDETDALYMLGSCAAFVSYLINKARKAGVIS